MAFRTKQIINVGKWVGPLNLSIGRGTRAKVLMKRTPKGKVYFMVKSYQHELGELRSEVIASSLGRALGFQVQRTWFCEVPQFKKLDLPYYVGVLVQLDVRRQRDTRRGIFREDLTHAADLIAEIEPQFGKIMYSESFSRGRNLYRLSYILRAIRAYVRKKRKATILWRQFFELACFDALIGGTDRHYRNWGILRKADSGKFLRLAPAFDNGISLLWHSKQMYNFLHSGIGSERFTKRARSAIRDTYGGYYTLLELIKELYAAPEYRGTFTATQMLRRLHRISHKKFKRAITGSIPDDARFATSPAVLETIYEYVTIRMRLLRICLRDLAEKYDRFHGPL